MAENRPTAFNKDRQPNYETRGKRGTGWRKKILAELEAQGQTEEDFIGHCLALAFKEGHTLQGKMIEMLINRLAPVEKSVMPMFAVKFANGSTPADKIDSLIDAVAAEDIPADVAAMLVSMIKSGIDVRETMELVERMERLEAAIAEQAKKDG